MGRLEKSVQGIRPEFQGKKKVVAGQDQFGAAHGALTQAPQVAPQVQQTNGPTSSAADLDEHFDALAAAVTTEKGVLEEIVKDNAALTITNAELSASVASLIKANKKLSRRVFNCRNSNNHTREYSPEPHPKTMCPHFKIGVMHAPNNCFELDKNSNRCPRGWKSHL